MSFMGFLMKLFLYGIFFCSFMISGLCGMETLGVGSLLFFSGAQ